MSVVLPKQVLVVWNHPSVAQVDFSAQVIAEDGCGFSSFLWTPSSVNWPVNEIDDQLIFVSIKLKNVHKEKK